jgi:hypothetical protein
VLAAQGVFDGSGITTFSDRRRDAVRGGGCDSAPEQETRQGWVIGLRTAPNEAVQALRAARAAGVSVGSATPAARADASDSAQEL